MFVHVQNLDVNDGSVEQAAVTAPISGFDDQVEVSVLAQELLVGVEYSGLDSEQKYICKTNGSIYLRCVRLLLCGANKFYFGNQTIQISGSSSRSAPSGEAS